VEAGKLDLDRDAWIVELDGRVAGFCELTKRTDELLADGYVHPEFFGRGVGTRLAELTEEEAAARGVNVLRNAVLGADERAHALLEARGYRAVRHFYRMVIELLDELDLLRLEERLELFDVRLVEVELRHGGRDLGVREDTELLPPAEKALDLFEFLQLYD